MAFAKRTALKAFCRDFIGWIWAALAGLACDCGSGRGVACVYRNVEAALLELFFNIDLAGRFKCQEVSAHPTDFVSAHRALGNVDCGAGQVGAHDVAFGGRSVSVDPYQAFLVGDGAHGGAYLKRAVKFRGMTLGEVGRVLEQLLRERVSIRDLGSILEAMLETAPVNKGVVALVEAARQALGRRLIQPLLDGEGQLPILLLDGALEEEILTTLSPETGQRMLAASTAPPATPVVRRLADSLKRLIPASSAAALPVLLCPSPARYHVKRWLEPVLPRLAVVSAGEIPPEIRLRPVGTVR